MLIDSVFLFIFRISVVLFFRGIHGYLSNFCRSIGWNKSDLWVLSSKFI